jgi:DNA-binding CsgD family transcriptional regulator
VFDIATVVDALRRIVDGETVIDPTIDPTIVSRLAGRRRRRDPLAVLSEREREVLGLIAEGMSNRAIAARLYVTERTVEAHVTQIFQKLGLPESPDQHRRVLAVLAFLRDDQPVNPVCQRSEQDGATAPPSPAGTPARPARRPWSRNARARRPSCSCPVLHLTAGADQRPCGAAAP